MAGLAPNQPQARPALTSRQFFSTIAWLRWRIFANLFRSKGSGGELAARLISYPILAVMVLGPSFAAGFGAWYIISHSIDIWLALLLWIIFVLWQFIGVSTSATGPAFNLDSLVRFPIRYRDYLLMRLSFGLMDPPTLAGFACLFAMIIGVTAAAPSLLPWAALALITYAFCNLFFSRMIYSWTERWLAQRRTREMVGVLILLVSLSGQFVGQFAGRFSASSRQPPSPWMLSTAHWLLTINWFLPPGLAASVIQHAHSGAFPLGAAAWLALFAYAAGFLFVLHLRLHAQYLGENLSEAPVKFTKTERKTRPLIAAARSTPSFSLLPLHIAAMLFKEFKFLLRSGPKLYALVMPVFVVFLFAYRTAGLDQIGISHGHFNRFLFSYGCIYTQLIFTGFLYNAFGTDGAGVQFYFIAPIRMRDVVFAKNLLLAILLTIEVVLVYTTTVVLHVHTAPSLICATLAWTAFAFLTNLVIGNIRSLVAPKAYDPGKVRRQNVSALSSFISLGVTFAATALAQLVLFLCQTLSYSYWAAATIFFFLAAIAFGFYLLGLNRIDSIASSHIEQLTRELSKS